MRTMKIEEILLLTSVDYAPRKVGDILHNVEVGSRYYRRLKERMREGGCKIPVCVRKCDGTLRNGHHRVRIAVDLGWDELPVTCGEMKSGWKYARGNTEGPVI